tara:strand:- start:2530 stop:2892 length:363 start_codon:yes stop_codon:yes gene_type:complete
MDTVSVLSGIQNRPAADLPPRVEKAISTAKSVAQRQVPAVPEDALTETYRRTSPPPTAQGAPAAVDTLVQLSVDDASGRVIGRVIDLRSGDVVRQIPSDEMLQLIAKTREFFGDLVNEKV